MTSEEAIKNLTLTKKLEDALGNFDGGIKNSDLSKSLAMAIEALGHQPCNDCISRQAAIDAAKEAYENDEMFDGYEYRLRELPSAQTDHNTDHDKNVSISCDHENDLISRQAAIEALYHVDEYNGRSVEAIRNLPSAEPKIGKWILSGGYWKCSECREKALLKLDKAKGGRREYEPVRSKHCPSCGTKMEGVKE